MATHDYVIANGTGAAVRSDINGALAAIVSQNSNASEPATMYAYQWWADTTTGLLKIRNAANSAWVTIGTLASANLGLLPLAGGTMTGVLAVTAGTAALPGIAVSGDPNTGIYSPGADQVAISTGGTVRATVDSSGRLLVGTSSARTDIGSNQTAAIQTESTVNGLGYFSAFNQASAYGSIIGLAKSRGASVGSNTIVQSGDQIGGVYFYGADGVDTALAGGIDCYVDGTPGANDMPGRLVFSTTADGGSSPTSSPPAMTIKSSQEVLIGTSTITANGGILQLKSGITFPATAVAASDANTLDDYEEGTWTPTIYGDATAGTGTYTINNGSYTKVGRTVSVTFSITWTAHTGSGNMGLRGLPFTSANNGLNGAAAAYANNLTITGQLFCISVPNSTDFLFYSVNNGVGTQLTLDAAASVVLTMTYQAA